ncbi:MAG: hypothetical protein ISR64_08915 [Deltaproteobacteria bacterium]|nr:hypothetical protein [Deltaproteobacteria bacterium]
MTENETSRTSEGEPVGTGRTDGDDGMAAVAVQYISVNDRRPEGYEGSCLRPLGLCDLGGCCDACWYSPDNPRFKDE